MITRLTVLFIFASTLSLANAATYYVDANIGKDTWSGIQSSTVGSSATDGPWQSLAKVSATTLAPGDSVLLKCGQVWRESLVLQSSGSASSPIKIGSYPSSCASKPVIDGSFPIPSHSWTHYAGGIYKASTVINLVSNGEFISTLTGWRTWSPLNDASMVLSSACASANNTCLSYTSGGGTGNSLISSNNLLLQGGATYIVAFSLKAPAGKVIRPILRRSGTPYESLGLSTKITGTGAWQNYSFPITATTSLANARLDFEVPPGNITIGLDNVQIGATVSSVTGVFDNGQAINVAHHPNRGHDALNPESPYFAIAENADRVSSAGKIVSTYLTTGLDLFLPNGASITPGTGIRVRTAAWVLDDRKIAAVSGTRLYFDQPTLFSLDKGWGYLLYGQLWMLDEPGEWYYDPVEGAAYVWMADGQAPGGRISVGQRDVGIEASNRSHLQIDGIAIRNVGVGVRMRNATNLTLRNMTITDTLAAGVDALLSTDSNIETSQFTRTGADAISAATGGTNATRLRVENNDISESGVRLDGDIVVSIPNSAKAAIYPGKEATVRGNNIKGAAYTGIWPYSSSLVSNNHIENTCLVLDDCGGIYVSGINNNSSIQGNTVIHIPGTLLGKPPGSPTQAQGIYLDDHASGITVSTNTIEDADNGVKLHDAANNRIENNTLYGNRKYQIWLQEQGNLIYPTGDVKNNVILGNLLFPTGSGASIALESELSSTTAFATLDYNIYSALIAPQVTSERWPTGSASYTLPEWQSAKFANNTPRNLDLHGTQVKSIGYAAYRVVGGNSIPNGNFQNGKTGWVHWNQTSPYGTWSLETSSPGQTLRYTAGASQGLLHSPNFTVIQGQSYRVSLDLKTGANGQAVSVLVRRGGGGTNLFEALMGAATSVTGTTNWKRYSFTFKATKTVNANDPTTLDNGARIDFERIQPGQTVNLANLEMVPLAPIETTLRTRLLFNSSDASVGQNCPDQDTEPTLCDQFAQFSDGAQAIWPMSLPPRSSEVIYSRDDSLMDADSDGIPDSQDTCPATATGANVNALGCSFSQSFP
jgi:parallel beta-helix repeat protein